MRAQTCVEETIKVKASPNIPTASRILSNLLCITPPRKGVILVASVFTIRKVYLHFQAEYFQLQCESIISFPICSGYSNYLFPSPSQLPFLYLKTCLCPPHSNICAVNTLSYFCASDVACYVCLCFLGSLLD